ncbi:MAG: hypothetical protein AB8B73_14100 [Ekhidna sp.]
MSVINNFSTIGVTPQDTPELKAKKSFLVFLAAFMSGGGLLWGTIAMYHGLIIESLIPYGYVVISLVNIVALSFFKNFGLARFVQILISLLLPFMFQWSLGGFFSSGLIMLWAILALVASPSFQSKRSSVIWLVLFLGLTAGSAIYDDSFYQSKPEILADHSLLFLTLNAAVISSIVYGLVIYYVSRSDQAQEEVKKSGEKLRMLYANIKQKNAALEKAQKELQATKDKLQAMTSKQIKINESLLKKSGMIK